MPAIAIRKSAWDSATEPQRQILRWSSPDLALGVPATYRNGALLWYVFNDSRFTLEHVARLGTLVSWLATLPRDWIPPTILDGEGKDTGQVDRAAAAERIADLARDIVLPKDIEYEETITVQVPDRERRIAVDSEGIEFSFWFDLGTTHPEDEVQTKANIWQVTIDAQRNSGAIRATGAVPADWRSVDVDA